MSLPRRLLPKAASGVSPEASPGLQATKQPFTNACDACRRRKVKVSKRRDVPAPPSSTLPSTPPRLHSPHADRPALPSVTASDPNVWHAGVKVVFVSGRDVRPLSGPWVATSRDTLPKFSMRYLRMRRQSSSKSLLRGTGPRPVYHSRSRSTTCSGTRYFPPRIV
jgi:hypothetical protein